MLKALGYIRRSKKSDENTVSLSVQESAIRDYCAKAGMVLVGLVIHDGISGTKRGRFKEIENAVQLSGASALVVYHLDRLARDVSGLGDYLCKAQKDGVEIHEAVTGRLDTERSLGKFVTHIRASMDEFYAGVIGEKTKDALAQLRSSGRRYTNIPPLGFRYDEGRLVQEPTEQAALAVIATCRAQGMGRIRTLRVLQESGYTGRSAPCTIQKALKTVTDPLFGLEISP